MLVYILGENIGDILTLLLPLKDLPVEVVFMEMACKDIDVFALLQEGWDNISKVQPVVEYQDGLLCLQHETAVEHVCQCHCSL